MGNWHLGRPATIRNVVSRLPLGFDLGRHAKFLLLTVTLGAGLVLVGCGDDDSATTPAPAPPPPPAPAPAPEPEPEPEPEPMAPATPTGLMVSATTETSITWTWDAVEGAIGYAVQVSDDEMFDASDQIVPSAENTFTAGPLPPETSVYVRVAAAGGSLEAPILSGWTTHVTGMSAMPPPEPVPEPEPEPEPDPVMVTFTVPDGEYPMKPDALDGGDEETAMATVNAGIMVESNVTAIITPMFIDGAAGVTVMAAADNMPFAYVDWGRLQADVVSDGATFMVQRATVGANQEMEPTGDMAYVTCGPFECADGMDAPDVTIENSMACTMWEPTLELDVGLIDNSLSSHAGAAHDEQADADDQPTEVTVFDGLDLGWTYTSSLAFNVTHDLSVVSDERKGVKKQASATAMAVNSIGRIDLGRDAAENEQIYYALSAEPDETITGDDGTNLGSCQPLEDPRDLPDGLWDYNDNLASRISKPDECFRLTVDHGLGRNYLDAYTVTMAPQGADVGWGEIAWEAWEDLTCGSMDFVAMEQVDVCAMFADEVDALPTPKAIAVAQAETGVTGSEATDNVIAPTLAGFNLSFAGAAAARHQLHRHVVCEGEGNAAPEPVCRRRR